MCACFCQVHLRQSLALCPDDALAAINCTIAYSELGQLAAALDMAHKAVGLAPSQACALRNRAAVQRQMGNMKEAEDDYAKALNLKPTDSSL